MVRRAAAVFLVLAFLVSGCSWFGAKEEPTADELVRKGMTAYNEGDYNEAIEAFEKLRDWYPFSKYAILAELKVADAYYEKGDYDNAVYAYEQFESLHPRNEAIPHVIFRIGMSYFQQIRSPDRDQTGARQARAAFLRLINTYPDSREAQLAADKVKVCVKRLAEHDLYVGRFYYKADNYRAAMERFQSVLENYPDVGVHKEALEYIAKCREKMQG
ncbi:MAG: outer membrane protein assembly factor BamD [Desulfatibacillaceae bacterium]